jgi:hypothetical protein
MVGFIELLSTRHVTTLDYSATDDLHPSQIITAQSKPSQFAFTSRFPVTASNNGNSSASSFTPLPAGHLLTIELNSKFIPFTTPKHGPHRKHCFQQFSIVALDSLPWEFGCFSRSLSGNGLHATMCKRNIVLPSAATHCALL